MMKNRFITALISAVVFSSVLALNTLAYSKIDLPDYTDEDEAGVLVDLTGGEYLDEDEIEELEELLEDTAEKVGFNVGVVVTDYIPNAEDYIQGEYNYQEELVEDYANDCFDEIFEDDGVLLVINFHTMYDYILSDGKAEEYIQEEEIGYIFDELYDYMLDSNVYNEIECFTSEISDICLGNDNDITDDTNSTNDGYSFIEFIVSIINKFISILGWCIG